jgi:hypothetical protein
MMDFVSWDHDIPKIWKIKFMFQTTNQMMVYCWVSRDITELHLRHLEKKTEALRLELRGRGDFPLPQDF